MQEMLQYYEQMNTQKQFSSKPNFIRDIEDIVAPKSKELHIVIRGRDRSNTSFNINNNFINQFKKGFDSNGNNDRRISVNYDSGVKIPKNNPLCNLNNYNKFDDPNLLINPLSLGFNNLNFGDGNSNTNNSSK